MISRNSKNLRPPFERWYSYILFVFIGFCIADLGILAFRDKMLPANAPASQPKSNFAAPSVGRSSYFSVTSRNIFSATGEIPDALRDESLPPESASEADPVLSQLPLTLIGTLVHSNPDKSIATIEIKGKNLVMSYSPKKEIEGMASIIRVERQKVVFKNLNNSQIEYIEIKKDGNKVAFGSGATGVPAGGGVIQKVDENTFSIRRSDLNKYTSDLTKILNQARAVVNRDPGTGNINGYKLVDIQPDSIFNELGLQRMDVIKSVDGTPVDSPAKAMELYNLLKNSPKVTLQIERNGKNESKTYNIQ